MLSTAGGECVMPAAMEGGGFTEMPGRRA